MAKHHHRKKSYSHESVAKGNPRAAEAPAGVLYDTPVGMLPPRPRSLEELNADPGIVEADEAEVVAGLYPAVIEPGRGNPGIDLSRGY